MTDDQTAAQSVHSVGGISLTPAQHQWLLEDHHGARPDRHRPAKSETVPQNADRLHQVHMQKLSSFPDNPPSLFAKLKVGVQPHDTLDILFSHCNVTAGHFALSHVSAGALHSVLSVNPGANDWYQQGIPEI